MSNGHQKKYQQITSDVLSYCEGVANITDDLDRLSEVGMTVNGDKCEFGLTMPKFFGHKLSSERSQ